MITKGFPKRKFDGLEMFAYYVALGSKRTLQQVADHFGSSLGRVTLFSFRNKWLDKVKLINKKAEERIMEDMIDKMVMEKKDLRIIRRNSLVIAGIKLSKGADNIKMNDCKIAYELSRTEESLPTKYTYEKKEDMNPDRDRLPEEECSNIQEAAEANNQTDFSDSLDDDEV